jgi:hypothetical protein
MIDVQKVKSKILNILEQKGPSLPIHLSRGVELSPVFTSAILSELVNERRIKLSNLRVGSSPLYLLPGHEEKLEAFSSDLTGMEKTAFLKLKQAKIIEDEKEEPAIRVALRSIKDFSIPIKINEKLLWKYAFLSNEELNKIVNQRFSRHPKKTEIAKKPEPIPQTKPQEASEPQKSEEPLITLKPKTPRIQKPNQKAQEFLQEVKNFLLKKDIEFLKELSLDKKELSAKVRINSDLGKISLLLIAKDKKRANIADLTMAYQKALLEKLPCLFLSKGDPASTTKDFLEQHNNLLKIAKIE